MSQYNLTSSDINTAYHSGLLPQRNHPDKFYSDTSCRCQLAGMQLSSENRRIFKNTRDFSFDFLPLTQFHFDLSVQKTIFRWIRQLGWEFPISSVKNVFTSHIFNYLYIWKLNSQVVAYSICYFGSNLSHIAYVFYDPQTSRSNLPIRLSLQVVIDSQQRGLDYCYLGRFDPLSKLGFYKRNFPNFQHFVNGQWQNYP